LRLPRGRGRPGVLGAIARGAHRRLLRPPGRARAVLDRSARGARGAAHPERGLRALLSHLSQATPSPSRSRSYGSTPRFFTYTGPRTYAGPLPLPPAQSTSEAIGTQAPE